MCTCKIVKLCSYVVFLIFVITGISGQIASYIHEGILVPDDLMVKLIHEKLVLIEDKSVLLDGKIPVQ